MDLTQDGESDMSGHRVQFADLPPNYQKGGPKFHSKTFPRFYQLYTITDACGGTVEAF